MKALSSQNSIILINNFISTTTIFFDNFIDDTQLKISNISNKVTELETLLSVLEAKLNSVPCLEKRSEESFTKPESIENYTEASTETEIEPEKVTYPSDFEPYLKLIKVGVPMMVVAAKVSAAGLDIIFFEQIASSL